MLVNKLGRFCLMSSLLDRRSEKYLQKREIDVYIVIKTQGWQLPHEDISHIRHSLSFHA